MAYMIYSSTLFISYNNRMILLVRFAYNGLLKLDWHLLEHNAGIITGLTLVATGLITPALKSI